MLDSFNLILNFYNSILDTRQKETLCAVSVFLYLDDWLIKNLIRNRLITQTRFCIQIIQSLGFLSNLNKSDLVPSQKFTFIGMEFLTQQNLVRVPTDRV